MQFSLLRELDAHLSVDSITTPDTIIGSKVWALCKRAKKATRKSTFGNVYSKTDLGILATLYNIGSIDVGLA